ncbi:DUF3426 domain-containing protein [Inquilinus sp. CAU 1745]|uniref:DUF3426 domain-containing protein n=1 Tax=Inquilinus sp. CAU 1745 TaxID=3140369 RepID=UPI00325BADDD
MLLTCPSCSTRYAVDSAKLGASGRKVRCARCSHQWFQEPPPETEEDIRRTVFAPQPEPTVRPIPPGSNLPATWTGNPPRRTGLAAAWTALALLVVGLLAVGYAGRDRIVEFWPPALKLYQGLGIEVPVDLATLDGVGPGLTLVDLTTERTDGAGGSVLWVRGSVRNDSGAPRTVPDLAVTLTGADGAEAGRWTFAVDPADLAPDAAAPFETSFRNVGDDVVALEIAPAAE